VSKVVELRKALTAARENAARFKTPAILEAALEDMRRENPGWIINPDGSPMIVPPQAAQLNAAPESPPDDVPVHNTPRGFLEAFFKDAPEGSYVTLVAIEPNDGSKHIVGRSFKANCLHQITSFVQEWAGKYNLYFAVNLSDRAINKKPSDGDIIWLTAVKADGDIVFSDDPRTLERNDSERAALLELLKNRIGDRMTFMLDSGGGAQIFQQLAEPRRVRDEADALGYTQAGERLTAQLKKLCEEAGFKNVQWDAVADLSRIMRLPGTLNIPTPKKREEKGRTEPRMARVHVWTGKRVELPPPPPPAQSVRAGDFKERLSELALKAEMLEMLLTGHGIDREYKGDHSAALFAAECALAHCGLDADEAVQLLLQLDSPLGEKAREKGEKWVRNDYARAVDFITPSFVKRFNAEYFVVLHGGQLSAVAQPNDSTEELTVLSPSSIIGLSKTRVKDPSDPEGEAVTTEGKAWFYHPQRRQYKGMELDPLQGQVTARGYWNMWQGFAFEPSERGSCEKWKAHLLRACEGDSVNYEYFLNWLARGVQFPHLPAEVAPVLRGEEGSGKGIIGRTFIKLFGAHGRHLAQSDHVTNTFNFHLIRALALFIDEAVWAGDPKAADIIKGMITEDTVSVHQKYRDIVYASNRLKIIFSSNHERVVDAGPRARRYFPLEVTGDHAQDAAYFNPIYNELANGGYARLLWELRQRDLSRFDIRQVPKTEELRFQQEGSLDDVEKWLLGMLQTGRYGPDLQFAEHWGRVPKRYCWDSFRRDYPNSRYASAATFGRKLSQVMNRRGETKLVDEGNASTYRELGAANNERAKRFTGEVYVWQPLDLCRRQFVRHMGDAWAKYQWPAPLAPQPDEPYCDTSADTSPGDAPWGQ
jgi:hypothetical protein